MDGQQAQQQLSPSDPLSVSVDEPEQSAGRFLLAVVLLVVLPILIVLPAAALARGTLLGTLLIDPEVAILSSDESDPDDGDVEALDEVAPAKTYDQVKQETENNPTGDHLAWPDSFFECVICLDSLDGDDMVRRLSCGHIFHSDCISRWYLRKHYTCPLCMLRFIPDDPLT